MTVLDGEVARAEAPAGAARPRTGDDARSAGAASFDVRLELDGGAAGGGVPKMRRVAEAKAGEGVLTVAEPAEVGVAFAGVDAAALPGVAAAAGFGSSFRLMTRLALPSSHEFTLAPKRNELIDSAVELSIGDRLSIIKVLPLAERAGASSSVSLLPR